MTQKILKGDTSGTISLALADGFDYTGAKVEVRYQGAVRVFTNCTAGQTLTFTLTAKETATMALGAWPVKVRLISAAGTAITLTNGSVKIAVTDCVGAVRSGSVIVVDAHGVLYGVDDLPTNYTLKDIRAKVNEIIAKLGGTVAAALLAVACGSASAASVNVMTARLEDIKNTEHVVTNVNVSLEGLATTNDIEQVAVSTVSNVVTKGFVESLGIEAGSFPTNNPNDSLETFGWRGNVLGMYESFIGYGIGFGFDSAGPYVAEINESGQVSGSKINVSKIANADNIQAQIDSTMAGSNLCRVAEARKMTNDAVVVAKEYADYVASNRKTDIFAGEGIGIETNKYSCLKLPVTALDPGANPPFEFVYCYLTSRDSEYPFYLYSDVFLTNSIATVSWSGKYVFFTNNGVMCYADDSESAEVISAGSFVIENKITESVIDTKIAPVSSKADNALAYSHNVYHFMIGNTNAWFAGTNYVTNADATNRTHFVWEEGMSAGTVPCSWSLWEIRNGVKQCVWDQRDWTAWYWNFKAAQMRAEIAATNAAIRAEIASTNNHAWARYYASSGRANPDPTTTYVDTPKVCLSPGMNWQTVAEVSGCGYWTIVGNGAVIGGSGTNAVFNIKDFEGNEVMKIVKGGHELVWLDTSDMTGQMTDLNGWVCFSMLSDQQPVGYFSTTLEDGDFVAQTSASCPAQCSWDNLGNGEWRVHFLLKPGITSNVCFAKFQVEVQEQTKIYFNAGSVIQGGLIYNGVKIVPVVSAGAAAGTTVSWVVAQ